MKSSEKSCSELEGSFNYYDAIRSLFPCAALLVNKGPLQAILQPITQR